MGTSQDASISTFLVSRPHPCSMQLQGRPPVASTAAKRAAIFLVPSRSAQICTGRTQMN
ncbi:hypothetical protein [Paenibacillus lautus]|uniref:hypothetical protein n=1 Tax=Paenibacillus lautus TaxID=1401 RepID=UPI003D2A0B61